MQSPCSSGSSATVVQAPPFPSNQTVPKPRPVATCGAVLKRLPRAEKAWLALEAMHHSRRLADFGPSSARSGWSFAEGRKEKGGGVTEGDAGFQT